MREKVKRIKNNKNREGVEERIIKAGKYRQRVNDLILLRKNLFKRKK